MILSQIKNKAKWRPAIDGAFQRFPANFIHFCLFLSIFGFNGLFA